MKGTRLWGKGTEDAGGKDEEDASSRHELHDLFLIGHRTEIDEIEANPGERAEKGSAEETAETGEADVVDERPTKADPSCQGGDKGKGFPFIGP